MYIISGSASEKIEIISDVEESMLECGVVKPGDTIRAKDRSEKLDKWMCWGLNSFTQLKNVFHQNKNIM